MLQSTDERDQEESLRERMRGNDHVSRPDYLNLDHLEWLETVDQARTQVDPAGLTPAACQSPGLRGTLPSTFEGSVPPQLRDHRFFATRHFYG